MPSKLGISCLPSLPVTIGVVAVVMCASACHADTPKSWVNSLKPSGKPGPELMLASKGKALYAILLPAKPTTQEEKAASELAQWLKEMTGSEFPVIREGGAYQTSGREISIGMTEQLKRTNLLGAKLDLGNEGYAIAIRGETLYLWGGRLRGPIYAVYALLEEDLGCRWYGCKTSAIPHVSDLKFRPVPRHFVPVLDLRDPYYYDAMSGLNGYTGGPYSNVLSVEWALHNRTTSTKVAIDQRWGGYPEYAAGFWIHSFHNLIPQEQYWEKHPEYYEMRNGKRQPTQLCLSNPDLLSTMIDRVKDILKHNPTAKLIGISRDDGVPLCECPDCRALDTREGSKSASLIRFVNEVADAIAKDFPDTKIATIAYLDTFMPPKTIRPRKNVLITLATDSHAWLYPFLYVTETEQFQKAMKAWHAMGANIEIWDYTVNFSHFLIPMPNMPVVTPDIRFYIKNGAKGITLQGDFISLGGENSPMRCWVWAKQLWDPSRDTRSLMRDFIHGYYGEAADPIWKYNDMLWDIWETNHKKPHTLDTPITVNPLMVQSVGGIRYGPDNPFLSKDFIEHSDLLFAQAERLAAKDAEILKRVRFAKLPLLYVEICQGVGYYDSGQYHPGDMLKQPTADGINKYNRLIDELVSIVHGTDDNVTAFAEVNGDQTGATIAKWREVLNAKLPKVSISELGNTWKFKIDPDGMVGINDKWYSPETADSDWAKVRSDLNTGWESQGFAGHTVGYGWYRQRVTVPSALPKLKHLYLLFKAVDEDAEVYIDGKKVYDHTCASTGLEPSSIWTTPFAFDATPYLKPSGENLIAVRVYNRLGMGGIYKPVYWFSSDEEVSANIMSIAMQLKASH